MESDYGPSCPSDALSQISSSAREMKTVRRYEMYLCPQVLAHTCRLLIE